ncbi:MAG TPA: cell wall-binding repeat-containing protein, partial [Candidatus Baltobacteraceae bacterium]|nr:cell wall-binding repeat-containing protein [Candidatus Baltobacteraceae bacterium]
GHVAGVQLGSVNHPFFWDGSMHDLGTLPGYPYGWASGINASDWVVGNAASGPSPAASSSLTAPRATTPLLARPAGAAPLVVPPTYHAFVWAGGAMVDLNTRVKLPAGWVLRSANAINDAGVIVGLAVVNGSYWHAFRLTPSNVTRIAGSTRYDTAAKISAQNYASPQATVYIATGANFPDALAGAALAGKEHAPLLLVPTSGALPASVVSELQRLAPTNIVIFGGTGAVSDAMLGNIETATGVTPTRIFGASRYDTAAQIAATYSNPQATVYIATGQNFPDALAGAALAGGKGAPLLLVPTTGALPASVTTELTALAPTNIVIFGGAGAVSTSVELQLAQY